MHEFSVALSMLEAIEEQLGGKTRLLSATVTLGPLSGIAAEALTFCFTEAAEQEGFGRPVLKVHAVPARLRCRACGENYTTEDMMATCPSCGSLAREVLGGDEFRLDSVEVEDD